MRLALLLCLWVVVLAAGWAHWSLTPPSDFGFTKGLNRVQILGTWHLGALVLAFVIWRMGRVSTETTLAVRLSPWPLRFMIAGFLGLVLLVSAVLLGWYPGPRG